MDIRKPKTVIKQNSLGGRSRRNWTYINPHRPCQTPLGLFRQSVAKNASLLTNTLFRDSVWGRRAPLRPRPLVSNPSKPNPSWHRELAASWERAEVWYSRIGRAPGARSTPQTQRPARCSCLAVR